MLITGASGALGRSVVTQLKGRLGYSVVAIGRHPCSFENVYYLPCDVSDIQHLTGVLNQIQPDWILHLAANFTDNLSEAKAVNVEPAHQILEWVRCGKKTVRVVLVGSAAEYGAVRPEDNPICEDRLLAPLSAYGVSKAWQTQLVGYYAQLGVDVICIRIFNLYGNGISNRLFAGRLYYQINEVLAKKRLVIEVGSLDAIRDYLDTETAAIELLKIICYGHTGETYHLASGIPISMRDFTKQQLGKFGFDLNIVREAAVLSNHRGYDVPVIYADVTKARLLPGLLEA